MLPIKDYLDNAENSSSFKDLINLKLIVPDSYILDISSLDEKNQSLYERSVLVSCNLIENPYDLQERYSDYCPIELEAYLTSRIIITNSEYLKLLYKLALLDKQFELKKSIRDLPEKLNLWYSDLEQAISSSNREADYLIVLPRLLLKYLQLSKSLNKKIPDQLYKVKCTICNLQPNIEEACALLDSELLDFFREDDELVEIIEYFFGSVRANVQYTPNISENPMLIGFFDKSIKYCDQRRLNETKHILCDYIVNLIEQHIRSGTQHPLQKLGFYQKMIEWSKYHQDSSTIKNFALIQIVSLAEEIKKDTAQYVENIEIPISETVRKGLVEEDKKFAEQSTYDCLIEMSCNLFKLANQSFGKEDNELHPSHITSHVMIDESGLPIGMIRSDEDRYFDKTKSLIVISMQLKMSRYTDLKDRDDFAKTLLSIKLFKSGEDKHVSNAIKDFLNDDYYGFVSRSIPLIEKKLRLILRELGEADIWPNDNGGFDYKTIYGFMSSDKVAEAFSEPVRFMFQAIYHDRRGFNLRNKMAHGIIEADEISLFHGLLVLFTITFLSKIEFE